MPNFRLRILCACLAAAGTLVTGGACRKSSETASVGASDSANAAATAPAPATKQRPRPFFGGNRPSPFIVSMSPDTIRVHDGHASVARYSLVYEIGNVERATKAVISINAPGVGEIKKFDVDLKSRAEIEFLLDASDADLGATVRFRAHCPFGDTDWFIMGSQPGTSRPRQIAQVYPPYVDIHGNRSSAGVPITISGSQFTPECTPEAQVDSSSVDLKNVVASDGQIHALLPYEALQGRSAAGNQLNVLLTVYGSSMPAADVYHLNFV